jgi:4-hydroxybutyrate CoA-transferase
MKWQSEYNQKLTTAGEAVQLVESGDRLYVGTCSSVAFALMGALWERRGELRDVEILSSNIIGPSPLFDETEGNPFSYCTYFMGPGERRVRNNGLPFSYTSVNLSEIGLWISETARPDICFFDVSPPDGKGYMSYGPTGTGLHAELKEKSRRIVAQVNRKTPYVHGRDNLIHISEVDAAIEVDEPACAAGNPEIDDVTQRLSEIILEHVSDGSTIQLGLGTLSTAIGFGLGVRNDLGIHSEMFNQPMTDLMKKGNVTNRHKGFLDGKSVFSFSLGTGELYDYLDKNEKIYCAPFRFVNDPRNIARNRKMLSINTTMAMDLFGQAASDSLGWEQQSATGGQLDFVRGAQWSEGGKSIIAATSSFMKNGKRISRILPFLPEGTAVTTPRSDVQYVATEYGCINLKILRMADRIRAMISLAHPDFREQLTDHAKRIRII